MNIRRTTYALLAGLLLTTPACVTTGGSYGDRGDSVMVLDDEIILDEDYLPRRPMNSLEEAHWMQLVLSIQYRMDDWEKIGAGTPEKLMQARRRIVQLMTGANRVYAYFPRRLESQINRVMARIDGMLFELRRKKEPVVREIRVPVYQIPTIYQIAWPLDEFYVSSEFGWRTHPVTGKKQFHDGIDLVAARGTTVFSAAPGKVVFTGYKRNSGNVVVVQHPGGYASYYAHLDEIMVAAGMTVSQGNPIGTVGNTGRTTGAHLHFKVTKDGRSIDPRDAEGRMVNVKQQQ